MFREKWIDVGGGDGDFYLRRNDRNYLTGFGERYVVLDPRARNSIHDGIKFIRGGVYPGHRLPFRDCSATRIDANFIIPEDDTDLIRFNTLLAESSRILKTGGVLNICDYQFITKQLLERTNASLPDGLKLFENREVTIGERSREADIMLVGSGKVSYDDAVKSLIGRGDNDLILYLFGMSLSNSFTPESIGEFARYAPYLLSFQKTH